MDTPRASQEKSPETDTVAAFARRRRLHQWACLVLGGGAIGGVVAARQLGRAWAALTVLSLLALGAVVLWVWRCPACRRFLGKGLDVAVCPHCGAKLQEKRRADAP